MNALLTAEERELIRLHHAFKKKVRSLEQEQKLQEDYTHQIETGDRLIEQIQVHASNRHVVQQDREKLQELIRDHAACPKCSKNHQLKLIGTDKSPEGWKSNKYRCRKCNIEFVWNAPNNPWDMIPYVEKFTSDLQSKVTEGNVTEEFAAQVEVTVHAMNANLEKLRPVVEASDADATALAARDEEEADLVKKFRKYLMIEKIKMEG